MSWESFYLYCFLIGFLLSLLSVLAGAGHLSLPKGFHLHLGGHGHALHAGGAQPPVLNIGTISAFLAWFGGTGYLVTRYSSIFVLLGLALAILSGFAGAAAVFWFLFKVLLARERDLDPADYSMIGVLGRVSSPVREGGIGEMIFSREGVRHCAAVRCEMGRPIPKGVEVVVTRYEKGIAYVRPWEELSEMNTALPSER